MQAGRHVVIDQPREPERAWQYGLACLPAGSEVTGGGMSHTDVIGGPGFGHPVSPAADCTTPCFANLWRSTLGYTHLTVRLCHWLHARPLPTSRSAIPWL